MNASQESPGPAAGAPRRWGWLAVLGVAVATALVIAVVGYGALLVLDSVRASGDRGVSTETGGRAPNIAVRDLSGTAVQLADFRGKTVLLNFRTTWCGYCRAEAPALQQAHDTLDGLAVMAVFVGEDAATVKAYAADQGLSFPMYLDGGEAAREYGVQGIPASFVIDAEGVVVGRKVGVLTLPEIQGYVKGR